MARKPVIDMSAWPSLTLEGNLISPAMVSSIDRREASEQLEGDYRIRKGLSIREEISTAFRVGQSHFDAFRKLATPSAESTRRFIKSFLEETFGFDDLVQKEGAISFISGGRVPIVVVPPSDEKLDRRSETLSIERTRSPAFALQDFLNERDEVLWGLVTNGTIIRLMRDNASLTRPAFIEADLAQIFINEDASSFAILWLLIHRTRFGVDGAPATDCALERWRDAGAKEGAVARDKLAGQVEIALKVLGSGFLEANPDLANKLKSGEIHLTEWFNELLRLIYRLIFLMVAEDRNLLHPENSKIEGRKLYAQGYSLTALRAQCYRASSWDKHHDRYEGVKIVFHALNRGEEALALPALGGLFADSNLPNLGIARLRNKAFMEALYRLSWLNDKGGMVPVNWRAMETEELGSVYESLLELQPQLGEDGKTLAFASEVAEQKGNQRKTTGSYYTPDSLVQALLDTALDPVLDKTESEAEDPAKALLKLSVIDPACGSGHFLLAAARRIATRVARIRADGTPSLSDFRHALRDVARSCLHGVDRNPMAVELTKVALWIETVDPGLPLGFFDAQIRCGDALLGVFDLKVLDRGIPDIAYKALSGDDKVVTKYYSQKNKRETSERSVVDSGFNFAQQEDFIRAFSTFRAMPEDTIEEIEVKSAKLKILTARDASSWMLSRACDLYVSAFLLPKRKGGNFAGMDGLPRRGAEMVPTSGTIWEYLRGVTPFGPMFGVATDAAANARAFHWPLEFPDVMQRGGFDVVLGNPPWERIKLQEQEFFASRSPEIANAPNKAARDRLIKALEKAVPGSADRELFDAFTEAKRDAEATSELVRVSGEDGGRFALTGRGDVNTYALFAELFAKLSRSYAGVILPTGIATDFTTRFFFEDLVQTERLFSAFMFDNAWKIFPAIHPDTPFVLMTIGKSGKPAEFASYLLSTEHLADRERRYQLSKAEILSINPNTRTAPLFRSRADAELTAKIYANAPVLVDEGIGENGNPWCLSFMTMFHMSNDSHLFRTVTRLSGAGFFQDGTAWSNGTDRFVPVYEGKLIHHFDHRWATYEPDGLTNRDCTLLEKANPDFEPMPRYWVCQSEVDDRLKRRNWSNGWLMSYRNITNATNERTTIGAVYPRCGVSNQFPNFFVEKPPAFAACLLANFTSLVLDFAARQKIGGAALNFFLVYQLPTIPPDFYTEPRLTFITPKVLELTYTSHRLAPFAQDLGYDGPPFAWDEERRALLRADLDAFYARAYGLTRDELRYILDPADVKGPDYPSETFRVLKEKEIRQYGEYRTRKLVLEAWDRMSADGTFRELGLTDHQTTEVSKVVVSLPSLETLRDGAWSWQASFQPANRVRYTAQYALWLADTELDANSIRFLIACVAEPALLTNLLDGSDRDNWIRLMGSEAIPAPGTIRMRPQINGAWRDAFNNMIISGQLSEGSDGRWNRGEYFDSSILQANSIEAQRTAFALEIIRKLDTNKITASLAQEDNIIWARFGNGS